MEIFTRELPHILYLIAGTTLSILTILGIFKNVLQKKLYAFIYSILDKEFDIKLLKTQERLEQISTSTNKFNTELLLLTERQKVLEQTTFAQLQSLKDVSKKIDNIYNILINLKNS